MKHGSKFDSSIPILVGEHQFPDCNDPGLLLASQNELRKEWDDQLEIFDELTDYTNPNTKIYYALNKSVAGTAKREFIETKIWFRESDTVDDPA